MALDVQVLLLLLEEAGVAVSVIFVGIDDDAGVIESLNLDTGIETTVTL